MEMQKEKDITIGLGLGVLFSVYTMGFSMTIVLAYLITTMYFMKLSFKNIDNKSNKLIIVEENKLNIIFKTVLIFVISLLMMKIIEMGLPTISTLFNYSFNIY